MKAFKPMVIVAVATVVSLSLISCIGHETKTVTANSSPASNIEEDIKTPENEKIFANLIYNYYNESVGREYKKSELQPPYKCADFNGKITAENAESVIRCSIDCSFKTSELEKYTYMLDDGSYEYRFSQDTIKKAITENFYVTDVDCNIFKSFDKEIGQYKIYHEDFGGNGELFGTPDIKSIIKNNDTITVKADFCADIVESDGTMPTAGNGLCTPDKNKVYQTCLFYYKKSGANYLLSMVESV